MIAAASLVDALTSRPGDRLDPGKATRLGPSSTPPGFFEKALSWIRDLSWMNRVSAYGLDRFEEAEAATPWPRALAGSNRVECQTGASNSRAS